eukprot:4169974-Pleurochrysis_carterae.AAC.2
MQEETRAKMRQVRENVEPSCSYDCAALINCFVEKSFMRASSSPSAMVCSSASSSCLVSVIECRLTRVIRVRGSANGMSML